MSKLQAYSQNKAMKEIPLFKKRYVPIGFFCEHAFIDGIIFEEPDLEKIASHRPGDPIKFEQVLPHNWYNSFDDALRQLDVMVFPVRHPFGARHIISTHYDRFEVYKRVG